MPKHRNLNLKKFIDSIPESLIKEYFQRTFRSRVPAPLNGFDYGTIKNVQKFIENDGSKNYRISTHPDFITYNKKKLRGHPDGRVREIAKKLR
jgi:hypothetical protein